MTSSNNSAISFTRISAGNYKSTQGEFTLTNLAKDGLKGENGNWEITDKDGELIAAGDTMKAAKAMFYRVMAEVGAQNSKVVDQVIDEILQEEEEVATSQPAHDDRRAKWLGKLAAKRIQKGIVNAETLPLEVQKTIAIMSGARNIVVDESLKNITIVDVFAGLDLLMCITVRKDSGKVKVQYHDNSLDEYEYIFIPTMYPNQSVFILILIALWHLQDYGFKGFKTLHNQLSKQTIAMCETLGIQHASTTLDAVEAILSTVIIDHTVIREQIASRKIFGVQSLDYLPQQADTILIGINKTYQVGYSYEESTKATFPTLSIHNKFTIYYDTAHKIINVKYDNYNYAYKVKDTHQKELQVNRLIAAITIIHAKACNYTNLFNHKLYEHSVYYCQHRGAEQPTTSYDLAQVLASEGISSQRVGFIYSHTPIIKDVPVKPFYRPRSKKQAIA